MKRNFTLLASTLLVTCVSFGQSQAPIQVKINTNKIIETPRVKVQRSTEKAAGDTLWSTDFENATNWLSTAVNSSPAGDYGWQIGDSSTTKSWALTKGIKSTSEGKFALCENGDPRIAGNAKANTEWILTLDSSFNFGSLTNVICEFEQYGARFSDYQAVEVSNDGGVSWVELSNNNDLPRLSNIGGSYYANPNTRRFNASAAFPGQDLVNFRIRFRVYWPEATNSGIMYGWIIDDLRFIEGAEYDVALKNLYISNLTTEFEVPTIPKEYAGDYKLNLQATVKNNSVLDPSSTQLQYFIKKADGTLVKTATGGTTTNNFNGYELDTIYFETGVDLSTYDIGVYTVDAIVKLPSETDGVTSNDTLRRTIRITDKYLSQTNLDEKIGYGNISRALAADTSTSKAMFAGSVFYAYKDMDIHAYELFVPNTKDYPTTAAGDLIITLYEYDPQATANAGIFTLQDEERYFDLADLAPAKDSSRYVVFDFAKVSDGTSGSMFLAADRYYMVAFSHGGGLGNHIAYGQNLTDDDNSSWVNGAFSGATSTTPQNYRLGYQLVSGVYTKALSSVGVEENKQVISAVAAPNPFNNVTKIMIDLKSESTVGVVITDMAGRVVQTTAPTSMTTGLHDVTINGEALNAGVYNCSITINNEVVTKRIVKK